MTERPSQNTKILQKLEEIDKKVTRIEAQIEYQPKIDAESHKAIAERFSRSEDRIKKIEEAQLWAMRLIIGTALSSLVAIVLAFTK